MNPEEDDIKKLPKERLLLIEHDIYKWVCCAEGCNGYTRVKDYGESPFYLTRWGWLALTDQVLYCSRHWKLEKAGVKFTWKENPDGIDNLIFEKSVTFK
jgi:hypothetical protein